MTTWQRFTARPIGLILASTLAVSPMGACSSHSDPPPPVDDTVRGGGRAAPMPDRPADKPGMSTTKKVVILAGAAALYYMYKHHKAAATQEGVDGQYYLSKNGRVYYRDAEHRAHWVTAPPSGIEVPAAEAAEYQELQGYDNRATGKDLVGMGSDPE